MHGVSLLSPVARIWRLPTPLSFNRNAQWGPDSSLVALCAPESHLAKRVLHEASFLGTNLVSAAFGPRPDLIVVTTPPLGHGTILNYAAIHLGTYSFGSNASGSTAAGSLSTNLGQCIRTLRRA